MVAKKVSMMKDPPVVARDSRLADQVHGWLYEQLMSSKIEPGSRIAVDSLVREFGVSQTPIREAMSRLEAQGLVVKTHNVGYRAAEQIDPESMRLLFEMRMQLEPFVAERAAEAATDETIERLQILDASMQRLAVGADSSVFLDYANGDGEFHNLIAVAAGNDFIRDALSRLHTHVHLFRLRYMATALADVNDEHANIIEAIHRRDPVSARDAMRHHIEQSSLRFDVRR